MPYVIVTILAAYALAGVYAVGSELWQPRGTFGIVNDYGTVVRAVTPGGPAARAGIAPGDEIDLHATPFGARRFLVGVMAHAPVGRSIRFPVRHDGTERTVTLVAVPHPITGPDRASLFLACAAAIVFVVVGGGLILLRPSAPTWGFGVYCLVTLPTANYPFHFTSAELALATICIYDVVQNVGIVGLLVFALSFPRPLDGARRDRLRRSLPAVFVLLSAMTLYPDVATLVFGRGARLENGLLQLAFGAVFAITLVVLWNSYRRIEAGERERMRWVLAGFWVGLAASYIGNTILFSSLIPIDPPSWLLNVLISLNVLLPLTVAYAVVRHRVLDINVAVSLALIYTVLTFVLAGTFSLFDWLFGHVLEDFRLSLIVSAGVSIAFAFAFNALHHFIEHAVEGIFFRKRRATEERLTRLANELPDASSVADVQRALVGEVADALELSSAALFLHDTAGYRRTSSVGWGPADRASLDETDDLVRTLRAARDPLALSDASLAIAAFPGGPSAPVMAFPLQSRAELAGIVAYGAIRSGRRFDATELALLDRLVRAAGIALDVLDAERLRAENATQAATIAQLRERLDASEPLPPARR